MRLILLFLSLPLLSQAYPIIEKKYSNEFVNSFSVESLSYPNSSNSQGSNYGLGVVYEKQLSHKYTLGLGYDFDLYTLENSIQSRFKIQNKYYFSGMNRNSFYSLASPKISFQKNQKSRLSLDLGFGYQWLFGKKKNYSFNVGANSNIRKGEISVSPTLSFGLRF